MKFKMIDISYFPDHQNFPNPKEYNNLCRICLRKRNEVSVLQSIRNPGEDTHNLFEKIQRCISINISEEYLPNKICDKCVNVLLIADYFIVLSETSENILIRSKSLYSQKSSVKIGVENSIKEEQCIDIELNENYNGLRAKHEVISQSTDKNSRTLPSTNMDNVKPLSPRKRKCSRISEFIKPGVMKSDPAKHECTLCDAAFHYKADLARHMSTHELGSYKCYGCTIVFEKYSERSQHEISHCPNMPPGTKYECSKCSAKCENRFRYEYHTKHECGKKLSECETSPTEVVNILEQESPADLIHKCVQCDYFTDKKGRLLSHIQNCHLEKLFVCDICGLAFSKASSVKFHKNTTHTDEKKYKCQYCSYATKYPSSLRSHIRIHTQDYRYSCDICGRSFKVSSTFHDHVRSFHKEKEHQCEYCKKMFSIKGRLNMHVRTVHLGIKPHHCKECNRTFTLRRDMRIHMLKQHNIVLEKRAPYLIINKNE